jgi:deoxyribodipyrimidine photo-lyase
MTSDTFPATLAAAHARIAAVRPADYARSRNALEGAVTRLSPYIAHGFVTLPEVLAGVADKHRLDVQHKFVFELGWREFFQHVWAQQGAGILRSIHAGPMPEAAYARELPADIREARTGVPVIDQAVRTLYATGYLHNHARMWLASYVFHLRKVHWRAGADWLYGHLLDGDLASNHLSWQWVAGTGSSKPYLFNAENVARYAPPDWHSPRSVIDTSYEALDVIARNGKPVLTKPLAEGVTEPALLPKPPAELGFAAPDAAAVEGRDVWLVHPWMLGALPPDLAPGTVVVAIAVADFHRKWPWSPARWAFVSGRMAELTPHRWFAEAGAMAAALRGARSVQTVADAHIQPQLNSLAKSRPATRLFAPVDRPCTSFSQWWTRTTRDAKHLHDLPGLIDLGAASAGPLFDQAADSHPQESASHDNNSNRPGDRRPRWHRP